MSIMDLVVLEKFDSFSLLLAEQKGVELEERNVKMGMEEGERSLV